MKNLKEILYFKRRKKLQLEEDLKKLDNKINKNALILLFLSLISLLIQYFDYANINSVIMFILLFYAPIPLFYLVKSLDKINYCILLEKEIDVLYKDLNNQLEMNS